MFTQEQILTAWNNAKVVDGYDSSMVRKDACGAWIVWSKYGHNDSPYGWEVDHIFPQSLGGDEHSENLRAMQHANNAAKGNDYPSYKSTITSDGDHNVMKSSVYVVNEDTQQKLKKIYKDA